MRRIAAGLTVGRQNRFIIFGLILLALKTSAQITDLPVVVDSRASRSATRAPGSAPSAGRPGPEYIRTKNTASTSCSMVKLPRSKWILVPVISRSEDKGLCASLPRKSESDGPKRGLSAIASVLSR